ncbi:hypothetical protein RKE29_02210 [Streptomyces sp. B1866]|uniref:hypothetical protein n=1 Tax=Streptomyces sp. B1866 TaxID=3075431 RepID=UPI0028900F8F|nr:hypothetical protein [Streptomyces sp. B1866]MDT3395475.1 hypothetical protein [Streptomyces sp. B1866]
MSELVELPPDWHATAWPAGWDFDKDEDPNPDLKRFGYVLLPAMFHVVIQFPELLDGKSIEDIDEEARSLIITFEVIENNLIIREMYGVGIDISEWISHVIERFPPEKWKPLAVSEMTQFLAFNEKRKRPATASSTAYNRTTDQTQGERRAPGRRGGGKRFRITPEHLDEVARIYLESANNGLPPTRAVQEHFGVAHSTAAKWVSAARQTGTLPPVSHKGTK